jgi:hypothetical protein
VAGGKKEIAARPQPVNFFATLEVIRTEDPAWWKILRARDDSYKNHNHSLSVEPRQAFLAAPPGEEFVRVVVLYQSSRAARQGKPSVIVHWRPLLSPIDL